MSTTASLSLLQKGGKTNLSSELEKPAPVPAQTEDEDAVVVDIDTMTEEQLDAFVVENDIGTPLAWEGFDHAQKVAWMKEAFGDEAEPAPAQPTSEEVPMAEMQKAVAALSANDPLAEKEIGKAIVSIAEGLGVTVPQDAKDAVASLASTSPAKGKKGKKKGTAIEPSKTKDGEILEPDILQDLIHEIENLSMKDTLAELDKIGEQTDMNYFRMGGLMANVQANGWFEPYASFKDFVEGKFGLKYRKAIYLVEIYNRVSASGVAWAKVSKIGWTKLKEIGKVITPENVDEWVKIAETQNTITLIDTVNKALAKPSSTEALEGPESNIVTTMTFKVHDGQKAAITAALEKAKEASGTNVNTVALELMAIDYMGGMTLAQRLTNAGLDKALAAFEIAFPDAKLTLDMAGESDNG